MKEQDILTKNTDEIIALIVVAPIVAALVALAVIGKASPELLLGPLGMVLGHYFTKKTQT